MSSAPTKLWTRFDPLVGGVPSRLVNPGACFYARERISGGGYQASDANHLISNFKMAPTFKGQNRWFYKEKACQQFAEEVAAFVPKGFGIGPVPGSKTPADADYDPRFDMMFNRLRALRPDLLICQPLVRQASLGCSHHGGPHVSDEDYKASLTYVGFGGSVVPPYFVFVDDVVTSGRQFTLCSEVLAPFAPSTTLYGVFWARSVRV
jgi:hypothetical protein